MFSGLLLRGFDGNLGNINEFDRQFKICQKLGLNPPLPVYESWNPRKNHNAIFEIIKFARENNPITVRQAHYHLKILGYDVDAVILLKKMRMAGMIPMEWIVDDTRSPEKTDSWSSPEEILNAALTQYRSDWQEGQDFYVEVWLEKRTLRRIFYPITNKFDVYLCVGGGYTSLDMIRNAVDRFKERIKKNQIPTILYFGDLNPSGKDIARAISETIEKMGIMVQLREIAVNVSDVIKYNLPKNPLSKKDSRIKWFKEKYGINYSVELDAFEPYVLKQKVKDAITAFLDVDKLHEKEEKDEQEKAELRKRIDI